MGLILLTLNWAFDSKSWPDQKWIVSNTQLNQEIVGNNDRDDLYKHMHVLQVLHQLQQTTLCHYQLQMLCPFLGLWLQTSMFNSIFNSSLSRFKIVVYKSLQWKSFNLFLVSRYFLKSSQMKFTFFPIQIYLESP